MGLFSLYKESMWLMKGEFWSAWSTSILRDALLLFLYELLKSTLAVCFISQWNLSMSEFLWKYHCVLEGLESLNFSNKSYLLQRVYILYWKNKVGFHFHWLLQRARSIISNLSKLLGDGLFGKLHFVIQYPSILMLKGMIFKNQKDADIKIFSLRRSWLCNLVQKIGLHHSLQTAVPSTLTYTCKRNNYGFFFSSVGLCILGV